MRGPQTAGPRDSPSLPVRKASPPSEHAPRARGSKQTAALRDQGAQSAFLRKPPVSAGAPPDSRALAPAPPPCPRGHSRHRGDALRLVRRDHRGRPVRRSSGVSEAAVNLATGTRGGHGKRPESPQADRGRALERLRSETRRGAGRAGPAGEDATARELRRVLRRTLICRRADAAGARRLDGGDSFPGARLALLLLTLPVYLYGGWPFLSGMVRTLRHRAANMDTLVGLGTTRRPSSSRPPRPSFRGRSPRPAPRMSITRPSESS